MSFQTSRNISCCIGIVMLTCWASCKETGTRCGEGTHEQGGVCVVGPAPAAGPSATHPRPSSACRSRILYATKRSDVDDKTEFSTANPDGTGAEVLQKDAAHYPIGWSPDGKRLLANASSGSNVDLVSLAVDGSKALPIATTPEGECCGVWSPDGAKVAYERTNSLWVVNSDGNGAQQVASALPSTIAWAPSGARIAFDTADGIYTLKIDGTELAHVVTANRSTFVRLYEWSPDGERVLFVKYNSGGDGSELWTVGLDGTAARQLTTGPPSVSNLNGRWTPDGSQVVFSSNPNGSYKLFRIPSAGGAATPVTTNSVAVNGDAGDWLVDFSPAGDAVLFTRKGRSSTVEVADLSGREMAHIASGTNSTWAVDWSPCL